MEKNIEGDILKYPCRAVSGWGGGGGEFNNLGFLSGAPLKKMFPESKNFSEGLKILFQTFFDLNFSENSLRGVFLYVT